MKKEKIYNDEEIMDKYYRNEKILKVLLIIQLVLVLATSIGWIVLAILKIKGY